MLPNSAVSAEHQQMDIDSARNGTEAIDPLTPTIKTLLDPALRVLFCDTDVDIDRMRHVQHMVSGLVISRRVWKNCAKANSRKGQVPATVDRAWRAAALVPNKNYATSYTRRVVDRLAEAAVGSAYFNEMADAGALLVDYHESMHEIYEQRDVARQKARSMEAALMQAEQDYDTADAAYEELRTTVERQKREIAELKKAPEINEGQRQRSEAWLAVSAQLREHTPDLYSVDQPGSGKDKALTEIKRLQAVDAACRAESNVVADGDASGVFTEEDMRTLLNSFIAGTKA